MITERSEKRDLTSKGKHRRGGEEKRGRVDLKVVLVRAMLPIVDTDIELSADIMRARYQMQVTCTAPTYCCSIIVSCSLSNVVSISCLIYWLSMPPAAVHSNFVSDDQSSPELKLTRLQLERLWLWLLPAHLPTYSTKKMSPGRPVKLEKTNGARWSCNLIAVFVVRPMFRREGGIFECYPLLLFSGVGLRR